MSDWFSQVNSAPKKTAPPIGQGGWFNDISGAPEQTMRAAPALPEYISEDPQRMATTGQQAAGSLPTDEMTRVRYLASKRFPDVPVEKAMDRYFYKNDRLAYRGDDGKAYYEDPKFRIPTSGANIQQDAKALASGLGPAMPMIGGTLGGLSAIGEGPVGWGTGVAQATAGGAVADMARQYLAHVFTKEKKPFADRALQTVGAGAEQGLAQILGNGITKGLNFLGKTPTYDIPETSALRESADKLDIQLTPGEETGNRTLLRRQKILANSTEGEQRFTDFYEGRNEKVRAAVNRMLGDISPSGGPRVASAEGVEGAGMALKENRRELSDLASPYYKKAIDNNPQRFWSQEAEDLFKRPSMQQAIGAAKKLAAEEDRTLFVPTFENGKRVGDEIVPDWRSWDYMKKALDGIIEENTNEAGRLSQYGRSVKATKDQLMGILDKANPDYAKARGIFSSEVGARTSLERGVIGDAAKLEGNDVLRAGGIIFGKGSSPEDVRFAKQAFEKAGALDKWDALTRSHLEQIFNEIPDSATGSITNIGGTFRKAVFGNARKREILEAALDHRPNVLSDFMDLSKVLDATGRAMKGESITAFAQAGQRELEKEGSGLLPGVIETLEVWKSPSRVARYLADMNTSKYAARQAELFTTPEGRQVLKELRRLGPGSAGSVMALSHFLTTGGAAMAADALSPKKNGTVLPAQNPK